MTQSNKIFRVHSVCWDYGSTDEPKYSENPIFKHFFLNAKSNKKPDLMPWVFKNLWKKNNVQALPISQNITSKIGFSWSQSFCMKKKCLKWMVH
jgi:hypothetical protein